MKAMWSGFAAVALIAIVAAVALDAVDWTTADQNATSNTRID